jgi:dienelactone hydrolase
MIANIGAVSLLLMAVSIPLLSDESVGSSGLDLPRPGGPDQVGVQTLDLKDALRDRELMVTAWYPAVRGSVQSPYLDRRTAAALSQEWNLRSGFETSVHGHAWLNAAIAPGGPFPLILLEHGSGMVPAVYTVLAEGLASAGFIVLATNHPPDSLLAVYPDGHEVRSKPYWPLEADRRTQGVAIGKFAEDVLVADVRFVLDSLQDLNGHDAFWRGHIDLAHVGIVGHSMGGTTAALATRLESRIRVGVNLDGSTYPGMNGDLRPIEVHKPFLFLATEEHAANPDTQIREFIGSPANSYYVVVAGNDHLCFTDAPLLSAYFRAHDADAAAYARAVLPLETAKALVAQFFDKYLRAGAAPVLDGLVRVDRR